MRLRIAVQQEERRISRSEIVFLAATRKPLILSNTSFIRSAPSEFTFSCIFA
jgi:hypothetical protein